MAESDKARYRRTRSKQLAEQRRYDQQNADKIRPKKSARNRRPPKPKDGKCQVAGCENKATEYHHISYDPPRGRWVCSSHNPRPGDKR